MTLETPGCILWRNRSLHPSLSSPQKCTSSLSPLGSPQPTAACTKGHIFLHLDIHFQPNLPRCAMLCPGVTPGDIVFDHHIKIASILLCCSIAPFVSKSLSWLNRTGILSLQGTTRTHRAHLVGHGIKRGRALIIWWHRGLDDGIPCQTWHASASDAMSDMASGRCCQTALHQNSRTGCQLHNRE